MVIDRRVAVGLEIAGMVAGAAAFGYLIYRLYVRQYEKSHPADLMVEEEDVKVLREERKVTTFDRPTVGVGSLVRDEGSRQEQKIDYGRISEAYRTGTEGERIAIDTSHIVADARGTDKGRDAIDSAVFSEETVDPEPEVGGERMVIPIGDKAETLLDEEMVTDENGIVHATRRIRSTYPMGKSRAELSMRFKVIDKFEYDQTSEFYEKHWGYFYEHSYPVIAGFNGEYIEIQDDDMLAMVYDALVTHGLSEVYLRDIIDDNDYHITKQDENYEEAYERWVTGGEK